MKTTLFIPKFKQFERLTNQEKAENEVNKYVNITYNNAFNQIYNARKVIANYAKSKGVSVDIYNAQKVANNDDMPPVITSLSDKLKVVVSDLINKKLRKERFISADPDMTAVHKTRGHILLPSRSEESMESVYEVKSSYEDNFLRNLYRNIEDMANEIHPKRKK